MTTDKDTIIVPSNMARFQLAQNDGIIRPVPFRSGWCKRSIDCNLLLSIFPLSDIKLAVVGYLSAAMSQWNL